MGDRSLVLEAHLLLGVTSVWSGEFVRARGHVRVRWPSMIQKNIVACVPLGSRSCRNASVILRRTLWHLGYPDQALTRAMETVRLAQTLQHPFSMGMALNSYRSLHQFRGDSREDAEICESSNDASPRARAFHTGLAEGMIFHGWALTEQARIERGWQNYTRD